MTYGYLVDNSGVNRFDAGGVTVTVFSTSLHQTLIADLEGDTHGDFEDLLVALMKPPAVYDCQEVIGAIKVRSSEAQTCFSLPQCAKKQYKYQFCVSELRLMPFDNIYKQ